MVSSTRAGHCGPPRKFLQAPGACSTDASILKPSKPAVRHLYPSFTKLPEHSSIARNRRKYGDRREARIDAAAGHRAVRRAAAGAALPFSAVRR